MRTFEVHAVRRVQSLCGRWKFAALDGATSGMVPPGNFDRTIQVPSAWEQLPGLESFRGVGWYHTEFTHPQQGALRLLFDGVSHTGTVYIDGQQVGHHYDSYTPWAVVVPDLAAGKHHLDLRVDNTFGTHSALHIPGNDYYSYGGITRPVEMQWVPDVFLKRVAVSTIPSGAGSWRLDCRVRVHNLGTVNAHRRLVVELEGCELTAELEIEVPARDVSEFCLSLDNLSVQAWTPEPPNLYFVRAMLLDGDNATDDLRDRVGFRTISVHGTELLLNGESLRLGGYNRHEDHPQFGNALPLEAMVTDLELLRDLGCNFVRTAHYPNDQRFLDLCDEMGFCVWEESHARQTPFDHPLFEAQMITATREMVEWHGNHPSIIMWGCLNECDSVSENGRRVHQLILGLLRELDTSRPVTFASNKGPSDTCLDLVDIVSWNLYFGWYSGGVYDVEAQLNQLLQWLDSAESSGTGKPVIISEFGADGFYGHRRPHHAKGTEEYQAELLNESLRVYLRHPRLCGAAMWQFCDVRVDPGHFQTRAMCMNAKGTVDEFRRPKLAYDVVKRHMQQIWAPTHRTSQVNFL